MTTTAAVGERLAVVLTGGGARAAYQAGVLCGIGKSFPDLRIPIVTGVSAGAINAAFLASRPGPLGEVCGPLRELWCGITFDDVFRSDPVSLLSHVVRWGLRLLTGGTPLGPRVTGLVDTSPLRRFLGRVYEAEADGTIPGIAANLRRGALTAIATSAVDYATGQTITWVEGKDIETWERPSRRSRQVRMGVEHVMASAALPLIFPAIEVDGAWYGDGGIRLAAPLSPAVHLGADRILAISTRYARTFDEADTPATVGYPPPAQILGNLMNAVFLDVLDQDMLRLERFNDLLSRLPPAERDGLRPIDVLFLRPSQDLGKLTVPHEVDLPRGFRFLTRALGTRQTKSPDFLSLLMFEPDYVRTLFAIGERDAENQQPALAALFGGAADPTEGKRAAPR